MDLITLQIVLSKLLNEILMLKGGNLVLNDILNYNKMKQPIEVQNFFILMEVYGYQFPINYFEPNIAPLAMQRRRSQKDLMLLRNRIREGLQRLKDEISNAEDTLGFIWQDLKRIQAIFGKVTEYYGAKKDILGEHQRNAELKKDSVVPLSPSMNEPTAETVGYLIDL